MTSFSSQSKLLLFETPKLKDIGTITSLLNDTVFEENTSNIPYPYKEEHAKYWVEIANQGLENGDHFISVIRLKDTDQIIGGIDLRINRSDNRGELGYWIGKKFWNQGYATIAVREYIHFGFNELKLKKVHACHFVTNPASGRVMLKAGMEREGFLKSHTKKGNAYVDHVTYGIINSEL